MSQSVSVIIPTWNRAHTIEKAIRSALEQTLPPLEVIVCDDGSTDNTRDIINSIKDPRVKWIDGPRAGRPAVPRNRGIKASKGDWLAFLDSDDEWLPRKLEKQLQVAIKFNCNAVCSNAKRLVPLNCINGKVLGWEKSVITFSDLLESNQIICSSVMIHRSFFERVIGFPTGDHLKAIEDYALWLRVASQTTFHFIEGPLLIYRDDSEQSIRKDGVQTVWEQQKNVFEDFLSWSQGEKISPEKKSLIEKKYKRKLEPPVTVLMPVYNGENFLKDAIESILSQTFLDFELLIIDDFSTDQSAKIIQSYIDPRIRYIRNNSNLGLVKTLNIGLDLAKGKYIARMDQDDISLPERLAKQVKFLDQKPEVGVCGTWIQVFTREGSSIINYPTHFETIKTSLLFYNCLAHPSVMIRKSFLEKFGLRYCTQHNFAEDYELWTRCMQYFPVVNLPEVLLKYRLSDGSITQVHTDKLVATLMLIHKKILGQLDIDADTETLILHRKIGEFMQNPIKEYYCDLDFISSSKQHLNTIVRTNEKLNVFPHPILVAMIRKFWFSLSLHSSSVKKNVLKTYFSSPLKNNIKFAILDLLDLLFFLRQLVIKKLQ